MTQAIGFCNQSQKAICSYLHLFPYGYLAKWVVLSPLSQDGCLTSSRNSTILNLLQLHTSHPPSIKLLKAFGDKMIKEQHFMTRDFLDAVSCYHQSSFRISCSCSRIPNYWFWYSAGGHIHAGISHKPKMFFNSFWLSHDDICLSSIRY